MLKHVYILLYVCMLLNQRARQFCLDVRAHTIGQWYVFCGIRVAVEKCLGVRVFFLHQAHPDGEVGRWDIYLVLSCGKVSARWGQTCSCGKFEAIHAQRDW